jgi:hypothetical protein
LTALSGALRIATIPAQYELLGGQKQAGSESKNVVPLVTVELKALDDVPPDPPVPRSELLLHAVRPRREMQESDAMTEWFNRVFI